MNVNNSGVGRQMRSKSSASLNNDAELKQWVPKNNDELSDNIRIRKLKTDDVVASIGNYLKLKATPYLGKYERGLFADRHLFRKNQPVTWYEGNNALVSDNDKATIMSSSLLHQTVSIHQYRVTICPKDIGPGSGGAHFANYGISKKVALQHDLLQFTANTRINNALYNGKVVAMLFATRDIEPGEQILIPKKGNALIEAIRKGEALSEEDVVKNIKSMYKFCDHCHFCSTDTTSVRVHTKVKHSRKKGFSCKLCHQTFFSKQQLDSHNMSHATVNQFECQYCRKTLKAKNTLLRHIRLVHIGTRGHQCPKCPSKFKSADNLRSHMSAFHQTGQQKRFQCSQCDKTFSRHYGLKVHMSVHSSKRDYSCSHCSQYFKTALSKSRHEQRHNKQHECTVCHKRFANSVDLRRHGYSHSDEKKFRCHLCSTAFKQHSGLSKHNKRFHSLQG